MVLLILVPASLLSDSTLPYHTELLAVLSAISFRPSEVAGWNREREGKATSRWLRMMSMAKSLFFCINTCSSNLVEGQCSFHLNKIIETVQPVTGKCYKMFIKATMCPWASLKICPLPYDMTLMLLGKLPHHIFLSRHLHFVVNLPWKWLKRKMHCLCKQWKQCTCVNCCLTWKKLYSTFIHCLSIISWNKFHKCPLRAE